MAAARSARGRARGQRAGHRSPGSPKARLDRALVVEPMRRWRDGSAPRADLIVTPSAAILPQGHAGAQSRSSSNGAPTPNGSGPARPGRRRSSARGDRRGLRRRVPHLARRGEPRRARRAARARPHRRRRRVHRRRPRARRASRRSRRPREPIAFTGAVPHDAMPAVLAAADIGVAPFDPSRARAAVARLLLVAAQDLRIHGGRPAGRRARRRSASLAGRRRPRRVLYDAAEPARGLAAALAERSPIRAPRRLGRAARERAPSATTAGRRTAGARRAICETRAPPRSRHRGARLLDPARTDAFPPVCGGSGWSTTSWRAAARARRHVIVVQPRPGTPAGRASRRASTASTSSSSAPGAPTFPFVRNYFKNERLYRSPRMLSTTHRARARSTSSTAST